MCGKDFISLDVGLSLAAAAQAADRKDGDVYKSALSDMTIAPHRALAWGRTANPGAMNSANSRKS